MIKVGIYGDATVQDAVRKQLLRLLLRHPDVDLRAVGSPAGNTIPLAELHPVFADETELTLERVLPLDGLDLLFVIDEENLTDEILQKYADEPDFRLIVLSRCHNLRANMPENLVYGLPEVFRKDLVRGARGAVCPSAEAMLLELALLPLAKNALLNADVEAEIATNRPGELEISVAEARRLLQQVQPSSDCRIDAKAISEAPYERLDASLSISTPIAIEEIERIYREAYSDHSFVHIIPGKGPVDEDLRGSNKCLIRLDSDPENGKLLIYASLDALTKGCTGNAVHVMDLLFGLYERTGLSI